jgi:hypothetical protein
MACTVGIGKLRADGGVVVNSAERNTAGRRFARRNRRIVEVEPLGALEEKRWLGASRAGKRATDFTVCAGYFCGQTAYQCCRHISPSFHRRHLSIG